MHSLPARPYRMRTLTYVSVAAYYMIPFWLKSVLLIFSPSWWMMQLMQVMMSSSLSAYDMSSQATEPWRKIFLTFSECVTGAGREAIVDHILQLLADRELAAADLRGQTYHGPGAMAGKNKGAASHIQEVFPKAIYTHCAAHALNLCVVKCCCIAETQNTMDTADSICRFFSNSPKRHLNLERWIHQTLEDEHRHKLKSMCKTRWVE